MAHFCPNMPLGVVKTGEKENLQAHQKWACAFCEPNFQEFRLKWWRKELFLHCGDELNGLRPSWMVLTHGNVIFDILEPPAFQKYSICWVFRAFFCSTFFYMYFANRPRPALTAVWWNIIVYSIFDLQNLNEKREKHVSAASEWPSFCHGDAIRTCPNCKKVINQIEKCIFPNCTKVFLQIENMYLPK